MVAQSFWISRTKKVYLERGLRSYVESCAEDFREGRYPFEVNEETEGVMRDALEIAGELELEPAGHVLELPGSVIRLMPTDMSDGGFMGLRVDIDANGLYTYHFSKLMAAMGKCAPRSPATKRITDRLRKSSGPFRAPFGKGDSQYKGD